MQTGHKHKFCTQERPTKWRKFQGSAIDLITIEQEVTKKENNNIKGIVIIIMFILKSCCHGDRFDTTNHQQILKFDL